MGKERGDESPEDPAWIAGDGCHAKGWVFSLLIVMHCDIFDSRVSLPGFSKDDKEDGVTLWSFIREKISWSDFSFLRLGTQFTK